MRKKIALAVACMMALSSAATIAEEDIQAPAQETPAETTDAQENETVSQDAAPEEDTEPDGDLQLSAGEAAPAVDAVDPGEAEAENTVEEERPSEDGGEACEDNTADDAGEFCEDTVSDPDADAENAALNCGAAGDAAGDADNAVHCTVISDPTKAGASGAGTYVSTTQRLNELTLILSGLTEANLEDTVQQLKDYYDLSKYSSITLENRDYVDAEKYSFEEGYDADHCWAGTAANMLYLSGWSNEAGTTAGSEDEIMSVLNKNYRDDGNDIGDGISFYMNSISENTKVLKTDAEGNHSAVLTSRIPVSTIQLSGGELTQIEELKKLASGSIGLSVVWGNNATRVVDADESHALTIVGVIYDAAAESAETAYKAIILADSDNSVSEGKGTYPSVNSTDFNEDVSLAVRSGKTNSYTVYPLSIWTDADQKRWWNIENYDKLTPTLIYTFDVLPYETEELKAKATETQGSCNATADPNLVTDSMDLLVNGKKDVDTASASDRTVLKVFYNTRSSVGLNNAQLSVKVSLYDPDGNFVTEKIYTRATTVPANSEKTQTFSANISDMLKGLEPNTYTMKIDLNPEGEGRVKEAYYLDNQTLEYEITVIEAKRSGSSSDSSADGAVSAACACCADGYCRMAERELSAVIENALTAGDQTYFVRCACYCDCLSGSDYDIYLPCGPETVAGISVDGNALTAEDFTAAQFTDGICRVSIAHEYMETLVSGDHTVTIETSSGETCVIEIRK